MEFLPGLVQLAEREAHPGQEGGAEAVECYPPPVPLEERHAELGLQPRDRATERGLRYPQLTGRPADVLMAGDGLKVAQLEQVHMPDPAIRICKIGLGRHKPIVLNVESHDQLAAGAAGRAGVPRGGVHRGGQPRHSAAAYHPATDHLSLAASQWALTISLLTGAVLTPVLGRLGDGRARRPVTLGAVAVMLSGCVLSAVPAGFAVFLTGRALQGAGFGLVPLATAISP